MTKKYMKYGAVESNAKASEINNSDPKLPDNKRQALYQELKSSGSIDIPVKYIETHLKSSMDDDL